EQRGRDRVTPRLRLLELGAGVSLEVVRVAELGAGPLRDRNRGVVPLAGLAVRLGRGCDPLRDRLALAGAASQLLVGTASLVRRGAGAALQLGAPGCEREPGAVRLCLSAGQPDLELLALPLQLAPREHAVAE